MLDAPKALIVHPLPEVRALLRSHLHDQGVEVGAETGGGRGVMALVRRHRPQVILLGGSLLADGIETAEAIHRHLPLASIVMTARAPDAEFLQRAMRAGVREVLVEPLDPADLLGSISRLRPLFDLAPPHDGAGRGTLIVTTSNKGGVGKTTVSTNLAVGLRRVTGEKVALVDLDLDFGDVATVLDLKHPRTIADLIPYADGLDGELLESFLVDHSTGVRVLPAPRRGQEAEGITGELVGESLSLLTDSHAYVVVDTGTTLDDPVLAALDLADQVILITTMDVVSLKNVAQMLDIFHRLSYPLQRVRLLANRWNGKRNIARTDAESSLGLPISYLLPSDYRRVIDSINRGVPFVSTSPSAQISRSILDMCGRIARNGRS